MLGIGEEVEFCGGVPGQVEGGLEEGAGFGREVDVGRGGVDEGVDCTWKEGGAGVGGYGLELDLQAAGDC